jgi:hypothetical protein
VCATESPQLPQKLLSAGKKHPQLIQAIESFESSADGAALSLEERMSKFILDYYCA